MHPETSEDVTAPAPEKTVAELIDAARADHLHRADTDPDYAEHAATLAERVGLALSDAGADDLAAVDYSDGVAKARLVAPPDTSTIDHNLLRRLDQLKQERARGKKAGEDLSALIRKLEEQAITQMIESGQPVGYPVGDRKASVSSKVWGKWLGDVTEPERWAAFREAGGDWAALVQPRVNAQTLAAMLSEWEEMHGELPDSLPEPLRRVMTTSVTLSVTFSNVARTKTVVRRPKAPGAEPRSAD